MFNAIRDSNLNDLLAVVNADNVNSASNRVYPLGQAIIYSTPRIVEALLEAGADPNRKCAYNALYTSIRYGAEKVALLLEHGASVEVTNVLYNPLHLAITLKYWDIVELLVRAGADVENVSAHSAGDDEEYSFNYSDMVRYVEIVNQVRAEKASKSATSA